jgi:hypothetical protein
VTRARVYQLLEDCAKVIAVRWPEGKSKYELLAPHVAEDANAMYQSTKQMFFTEKLESQLQEA